MHSSQDAGFHRQAGSLHVEGVRLADLLARGLPTPFYVYSQRQLLADYARYAQAAATLSQAGLPSPVIAYAVKANPSRELMAVLARAGAGAAVVSAGELQHVQSVGFPVGQVLLHGNGKRSVDIDAAIGFGALISIDSEFDLQHVQARAVALSRRPAVLLRVNPNIDPQVHPYISTGLLESKFGMAETTIEGLRPTLSRLAAAGSGIVVRGLHCHLGSTLKSVQPVLDAARQLLPLAARLRDDGHPIDTLDMGGGLGIDYSHRSSAPTPPVPQDLIDGLRPLLAGWPLRLWLEPGRSIVGRCGALIGRVIGIKRHGSDGTGGSGGAGGERSFLCTDASMAQLIRPCLYGAYHHIELLDEPPPSADAQLRLYDVVGPICESGDFIGQGRLLPTPREGDGLIIYEAGAYGAAMASRYNLNFLPAEYLIDGATVTCIRRAETYDDFARTFVREPLPIPQDKPSRE